MKCVWALKTEYVFYYAAKYMKEQEIATSGILRPVYKLKCFIS